MGEKEAKAALRGALNSLGEFGGPKDENAKNGAVARNIMQEEIGAWGTEHLSQYSLDEDARDRLLAHARQDAAHALLNSISALKQLSRLQFRINLCGCLSLLFFVVILTKLWR